VAENRKQQPAAPERSAFREYFESIVWAIALALIVRTFVLQAFTIPSGSMLPTLQIGDYLLVNKLLYGIRIPIVGKRVLQWSTPERGDVVVFIYPEDRSKDYIKRVQGLPGDIVEIKSKKLYINGEQVSDEHAWFAPGSRLQRSTQRDNFGPFEVPEGRVFVMGDNRDHSYDSRFWGTVAIDDIYGKAFVLYWSWNSEEFSPRWSRVGMLIP
jgi:signal peptidase I